jgi:hypothetical protein
VVSAVSVLVALVRRAYILRYLRSSQVAFSASCSFFSPCLSTCAGFRYKRVESQSSMRLSSSEGRKTTGCSHAFFLEFN